MTTQEAINYLQQVADHTHASYKEALELALEALREKEDKLGRI